MNISTTQTLKSPDGVPLPKVPEGSPFEDLFEDFFNKKAEHAVTGGFRRSGPALSSMPQEGLIVTNTHVIEGADEIIVNFADGSRLKVDKVVGKDGKTDLALLKVTPKKPLKAVKFGSSERLRVGDWVMAIGNPFGLGGSVTVGIISAKAARHQLRALRRLPADRRSHQQGQLRRSPVQHGRRGHRHQHGHHLADRRLDRHRLRRSVRYRASPSSSSSSITARRAVAGSVSASNPSARTSPRRWACRENTGALVAGVTPDSPAAKAGIEAGDVIVKFDGKDVVEHARAAAHRCADADRQNRGRRGAAQGREEILQGRGRPPYRREEKPSEPAHDEEENHPGAGALIGLKLAPLTDELTQKHGIDKKVKGLLVTEVDPDSPAAEKGIKAGDVIVEAAQEQVSSVEDLVKSVDKVRRSGRKAVLLRVEDGKGDMRFVAVPID